jgi:hypothetical protein
MTSPSPQSAFDAAAERHDLPPIHCDPLASLSPITIEVFYFGRRWRVPGVTADAWLSVLWKDPFDHEDIFPGMAGADEAMNEAMLDGRVDFRDAAIVAMEVLEAASGYRWWFTLKLVALTKASWTRIGGLISLDLSSCSLGRFVTAVLGVLQEHMEPKKLVELVNSLNEAPEGFEEPLDEDAEAAAFLAAMNQSL